MVIKAMEIKYRLTSPCFVNGQNAMTKKTTKNSNPKLLFDDLLCII